MPSLGLMPLKDAETGRTMLIDTSSQKVRDAYHAKRARQKESLRNKFRRMKVDTVEIRTNESYVQPLMNFFHRRMHRY
jgi:hypothetical protein